MEASCREEEDRGLEIFSIMVATVRYKGEAQTLVRGKIEWAGEERGTTLIQLYPPPE